jgi:imidazole glycerol-phosphate synthase subunit HisH
MMTQALRSRIVGIVDYQAGNIQSVDNAIAYLGARTRRVHREADLAACSHLVLPGVGAFGFCAEKLRASELTAHIRRWAVEEKRPMLGICVGMQLLADASEESPGVAGLGWIGGPVTRLRAMTGIRVPHVGWNAVRFDEDFGDFGSGTAADFYFDHSFAYGRPTDGNTVGRCDHGVDFSAIVRQDNIIAAQFHPEKSQTAGMRFLSGFLRQ